VTFKQLFKVKLIAPSYVPLETIQLLYETFFDTWPNELLEVIDSDDSPCRIAYKWYMNGIKTLYVFCSLYFISLNGEICIGSELFLNIVNVTIGTSKQSCLFVEIYSRNFAIISNLIGNVIIGYL